MKAVKTLRALQKEVGKEVALRSFYGAVALLELEGFHDPDECNDCWIRGHFAPCQEHRFSPAHPDHVCGMPDYCRCDEL